MRLKEKGIMKAKLAITLLLALGVASGAAAAIDSYMTSIATGQDVRLLDDKVLPAGKYDVQIHYQGFGNSAELWFFKGGVLKGKAHAEARGFPAQAPAATKLSEGKLQKGVPEIKGDDKYAATDKTDPAAGKVFPKVEGPGAGPTALHTFSWGAHGFNPGLTGKATPVGQSLKLSFDSANSAAGFVATLPVAGKAR
jgi:hypothetical protein